MSFDTIDIVAAAGVILISTGAGWIYLPAGLITLGISLVIVAVMTARASNGPTDQDNAEQGVAGEPDDDAG